MNQLENVFADGPGIAAFPWVNEQDRWLELLFCALFQIRSDAADATRHMLSAAHALGVLAPARLAQPSREDEAVLNAALAQAGWTSRQSDAARAALAGLARALDDYDSKVQKLLREAAKPMRRAVEAALAPSGLSGPDLRHVAGHWLQNVCNLPILIDDEALRELGAAHGLTPADLVTLADEIDLNVGALDNLLLHRRDGTQTQR